MTNLLATTVTYFSALIFAVSAWHKLSAPQYYARVISDYQFSAVRGTPQLALTIGVVELSLAVWLLTGFQSNAAAATGAIIFLTYAVAIGINLLRGRRDIDCGCGGRGDTGGIRAWHVWRNLLFAILIVGGVNGQTGSSASETLLAVATAIVAIVVYHAAETLISNSDKILQLRRTP
jgi:ABC-type amino acid transport system permease subunit